MLQNKQAVSQQTSIELPAFNQSIEIKVEVQDIFNKLLSEFPPEYKHKELVAHAIIGSTKDSGAIGYVYNALNGYSPMIDFKVGDDVMCAVNKKNVRYDSNVQNEKGDFIKDGDDGSKPSWKNRSVVIGRCKVVNINLYQPDKLEVEFAEDNRWGEGKETVTKWVNHKECAKWYPAV